MTTSVPSICGCCPAGCGIHVELDGDQVIGVRGDTEHPASHGYLCQKGHRIPWFHHQPARLDHPLLRGAPTTWDESLDDLAVLVRAAVDEHGPDAVGVYHASGMTGDTAGMAAIQRFISGVGTRQRYSSMTVDHAPAMRARRRWSPAPPSCCPPGCPNTGATGSWCTWAATWWCRTGTSRSCPTRSVACAPSNATAVRCGWSTPVARRPPSWPTVMSHPGPAPTRSSSRGSCANCSPRRRAATSCAAPPLPRTGAGSPTQSRRSTAPSPPSAPGCPGRSSTPCSTRSGPRAASASSPARACSSRPTGWWPSGSAGRSSR